MSEVQHLSAADIPEDERHVGIDNFWPHDRQARAAYSGNPGFRDGAGVDPLAYRKLPDGPLLAQPDIAEALEEVYLYQTPGGVQLAGIDTDLALQGLQWIKMHAEAAPFLRDRAKNTKLSLLNRLSGGLDMAEAPEATTSLQDEYERRRKAEEEAREAHAAERDAQIEAVIAGVKEDRPDLDFTGFLALVPTLSSSETPDGVRIARYKGFPLKINDQVLTFLNNPRRLVNDIEAVRHVSAFTASNEESRAFPIAAAYARKIDSALTETLGYGLHEDLSEEIVEHWFSAIDAAPEPEAAADILRGTGVLQRSMSEIVRKDPVRFIDRLHMLAMRGLDPAQEVTSAAAAGIISDLLKADAMAACSLVQASFFFEDPAKADTQQKAMDIGLTLMESGLPIPEYYSADIYRGLDRKEAKLIELTLVPRLPHGGIDWKTSEARYSQAGQLQTNAVETAFRNKALTRDGRTTTLYGRLYTHREKNSFDGRRRRFLGRQLKTLYALKAEELKQRNK